MARPPATSPRSVTSIGARLELDRLETRAQRLERVLDALRARTHEHSARGTQVPRGLASSLDDFQRELAAVRRAHAQLSRQPA